MTTTHGIQILGGTVNIASEVEGATKALRVFDKPSAAADGRGGVFIAAKSAGVSNSTTTNKGWTNTPVAAIRNSSAGTVLRVRQFYVQFGSPTVTTAGHWNYKLFKAAIGQQYTHTNQSDAGNSANVRLWPLASLRNQNYKFETAPTAISGVAVAVGAESVMIGRNTTAGAAGSDGYTLAGGNVLMEANPLSSVSVSIVGVAARSPGDSTLNNIRIPTLLWDVRSGDHAIDLIEGEGLVLVLTTPTLGAADTGATMSIQATVEVVELLPQA